MGRSGLTPGSEVGGYTIVAPLGQGGMGTVYRALDGGGAPVALKLLHGTDEADADARERLRREVLALQRLRHPAVAAVLDAESDSTEAFIVTELVAGPNLEEHVREHGPLSAAELHEAAEGLRSALTAVHEAGVVHRDLKPSNVLWTEHGPVLIDFGIAQAADDARVTSTGLVIGTPGYLAPELLDGAEPGADSDWWGWAALLAFAATGRAPFGLKPLEQVLARARSGDPDLAGVGPLTAGALRGALAPVPAERLTPADVVAALQVAVTDGDVPDAADEDAVATVLLSEHVGAVPVPVPLGGTPEADASATTVLAADDGGDVVVERGGGPDPDSDDVLDEDAFDEDGSDEDDQPVADETGDPADRQETMLLGATGTVVGAAAVSGVLANDGNTRVITTTPLAPVAPPSVQPATYAPPSVDQNEADGYDADGHDADGYDDGTGADGAWAEDPDALDDGDPGEYVRPFARRRWGSLLALALLLTTAAAQYPGRTLVVLGVLLVVIRTAGATVESMYARRERNGVRRTDVARAVFTTPWHLVAALLGLFPAVVVAGCLLIIVFGVVWWLISGGYWAPNGVRGADPTGLVLSGLVAGSFVVALVGLWWGPLSRMTRTGARRVLSVVAPGRAGGFVLVLLALAGAAVLGLEVMGDPQVVWSPLPTPELP